MKMERESQTSSAASLHEHQNWHETENMNMNREHNIKGNLLPVSGFGFFSKDTKNTWTFSGGPKRTAALGCVLHTNTHTRCQSGCGGRRGVKIRVQISKRTGSKKEGQLHSLFLCFISPQWSCDWGTADINVRYRSLLTWLGEQQRPIKWQKPAMLVPQPGDTGLRGGGYLYKRGAEDRNRQKEMVEKKR